MTPTAMLENGSIIFRGEYKHKDIIKSIKGAHWEPVSRAWVMPFESGTVQRLQGIRGIQIEECITGRFRREETETSIPSPDIATIADMPVSATPYAHQVRGFRLGITKPAAALLFEMGCGKSLTAVAICGYRYLKRQITRVLVVAPLSVVPVWAKEFNQYARFPVTVTPLEGLMANKLKALNNVAAGQWDALQVVTVNYESLWREELFNKLSKWQPHLIIADESQRIKNHQARQSKAMHKLGSRTPYRLLLTGTPVNNSPLDFWSQYRFLAPDIFESSYYAFKNHYADMGGYGGREIVAYKNLPELTEKAHSIACRVTKASALDLPPTTDMTQYCELEPDAARLYKSMKRDSIADLGAEKRVTAAQVITQLLRLSQITGGFIGADGEKPQPVDKAKLKLCRQLLEDLLEEENRKVVIFARFIPEVKALLEIAKDMKAGVRGIWGEVKGTERGRAVDDFQKDSAVRVFVAQIQTAGTGITLHAADTAIFYSVDYSYAAYAQAKARIHRIGQTKPCTYIHLVTRNTIDEQILEALEDKRDVADMVVDRWRELLS